MNAGPGDHLPAGMSTLERLREEGVLADDEYQRGLNEARRLGVRVEEALIASGIMPEAILLKWLAKRYRTQFLTTKKLSRAKADPAVVKLVPEELAARLRCCPLVYRPRDSMLIVACADPAIDDVAKHLSVVSGVRKIELLIARPAAVEAARKKFYHHHHRAFHDLLQQDEVLGADPAAAYGDGIDPYAPATDYGELTGFGVGTMGASALGAPPKKKSSPPPAPPTLTIDAPELAAGLQALSTEPAKPRRTVSLDGEVRKPRSSSEGRPVTSPGIALGWRPYRETTAVFVNLLEQDREGLRGHSGRVARICERFCQRLGLASDIEDALIMAAYVHDIGKSTNYHLTALNVARYEGHQAQAKKYYVTPSRFFESAQLPEDAYDILRHMYERHDGRGFPDKLYGKDIPLGARILAIAETFDDLVENPKNPYRKVLKPAEATKVIRELSPAIFDEVLAQVLNEIVLDRAVAKGASKVLLVDPDPEETTVLDLRFGAADWDVVIARDAAEALTKAEDPTVSALVLEVELPDKSGFRVAEALLRAGKDFPILFLTRKGDRDSISRGLESGAADYLVKPTSADVVVAKVQQATARAMGRGVSGSLSEMALEDVVQILANGRKTGRLLVRAGNRKGEIHFGEGNVWDASFDHFAGEEAVYELLKQRSGRFELEPGFTPRNRRIEVSVESLLLEGMRRLDES